MLLIRIQKEGKKWNECILDAINEQTSLVTLGNVHWADGTRFDLAEIRKKTRKVGALLVIDGIQSVGALPFDASVIQPDALICGSYKWMMGPYSIGMAYYGEAFDHGIPLEENWINRKGSENFDDLVNYEEVYQPGSLRYEVGEHSNFILVPMLIAAIKQLLKWQPENIQTYCKGLIDPYLEEIRSLGGLIEDEAYRANHLLGIRFTEFDRDKAKKIFYKNKVGLSIRGNAIRVAPNVYNDHHDMKKLMKSLREM